jgi:hypothetical protein
MMITPVIPTPSETQQKASNIIETTVTVSPNISKVTGTSPYLPVVLRKASSAAPESFIDLFWQLTHSASKRLKSLVEQGVSLWVESFSTIITFKQLETQMVSDTDTSYLTPAFKLKSDDAEASLVSSLIAERKLNTAKPFQSVERDAWLSANQWSGLDDLFPEDALTTEPEKLLKDDTQESIADVLPLAQVAVTSTSILGALHEAYPVTTPEQEACLKHPLIQRGREVKQNINDLVDAYFSSEDATN